MVKHGFVPTWAALGLVAACAHVAPLPEKTVVLKQAYLGHEPLGFTGELQHVKDGVWCSDDDAFSLPVIPYPDGPVTIHDAYQGWGVTCSVDMYNASESVLQIVRTRIRSDLPQQDVMGRVEKRARAWAEGAPMITNEWVHQNGQRQLQQTNTLPMYTGRESAVSLLDGQAISVVHHAESCRVDRHFVGDGYYFQIIAVAHLIYPLKDLCKVADEMAAWAAEHIAIGKGCGKPPK